MKSRTTVIGTTGAVLALCAMPAGRSDSGGPSGTGGQVVLRHTWRGGPDRTAGTEQAVPLSEKKHPGIQVAAAIGAYASVVAPRACARPTSRTDRRAPYAAPRATRCGKRAAALSYGSPSGRPYCAHGCWYRGRSWRPDRRRRRSPPSPYGTTQT
jgi:hypothetical protein